MTAPRARGTSSRTPSRRASPPTPSSAAPAGVRRSRSLRTCDRVPRAAAAWLAALVAVLSLFAGANALAQANDITTPTVNPDGSDTLWTATLTVAEFDSVGFLGFRRNDVGRLSSDTFTVGTNVNPVTRLAYTDTKLLFWETTDGFPENQTNWVLFLDERSFPGSEDVKQNVQFMQWNNPGLNWSVGDTVAVKLIRVNTPTAPRDALAADRGAGTWALSWTEPERTGGRVGGYQYRHHAGDGLWSVWKDVPDSRLGEANASRYTVGLSGAVEALELRAVNGAGASAAAAAAVVVNPFFDVPGLGFGPDGEETVFSATMTVGVSNVDIGFDHLNSQGSLVPREFTYDNVTVPVHWILAFPGSSSGCRPPGTPTLQVFNAVGTGWNHLDDRGVLQLGRDKFAFSDSNGIASDRGWCGVTADDLGWSAGVKLPVEVFIVNRAPGAPRYAAATAEEGGASWVLSWRAPVETGRWLEYEYRRLLVSGQWTDWTDIPASGTGQANASGYTVRGLTPGVAPSFELRGTNQAGPGPAVAMAQSFEGVALDSHTPPAFEPERGGDGATVLWRSELTVAESIGHLNGRGHGYDGVNGEGRLSPDSFRHRGVSYRIAHVYAEALDDAGNGGRLALVADAPVFDAAQAQRWVLRVDGAQYAGREAEERSGERLSWRGPTPSGLGWSAGVRVSLELVRVNPPDAPSRVVAVHRGASLALTWAPPARLGGALDGYEYRRRAPGGAWTGWTDIPDSAAGGANAAGYAVAGPEAGEGDMFELRARNVAGAGAAASAAAAFPPPDTMFDPRLNLDGSETIWEAKLTVWDGSETIGYHQDVLSGHVDGGDGFGLNPAANSFTYNGVTHTINEIRNIRVGGDELLRGELVLSDLVGGTDDGWREPHTANWALRIGDKLWAFSDAGDWSPSYVEWHGVTEADVGWSGGDVVPVAIVAFGTPGAPRDARAVLAGGRWALSWRAPRWTGGRLDGYEYRYRPADGGAWSAWAALEPVPGEAHTATGLGASVSYEFELRAYNPAGKGAVAAVAAVTPPPVTGGGPRLDADGAETLWEAVLTVGGSLDFRGYNSTSTGYGGLSPASFTVGSRQIEITLLYHTGEPDSFNILASDNLDAPGAGRWVFWLGDKRFDVIDADRHESNLIFWYDVTLADLGWSIEDRIPVRLVRMNAPVDAPQDVVADGTERADGLWRLAWRAPVRTGGRIDGYEWRRGVGDASAREWTAWEAIPDSAPGEENGSGWTVAGLEAGVAHVFEVRARNPAGSGPAALAIHTAGAAAVPGPPRDVHSMPAPNPDDEDGLRGAWDLWWQAPERTGGEILGYQHRRRLSGADWGGWRDVSDSGPGGGSAGGFRLSGLSWDADYDFEVRARNAAGPGPGATAVRVSDGEVLVRNTFGGDSRDYDFVHSARTQAQRFVTGNHLEGYVLQEVVMGIDEGHTPDHRSKVRMTVRAEASNGAPGAVLYELENPTTFVKFNNTFTAPKGPDLEPDTGYFVVVEYDEDDDDDFAVSLTGRDGVEGGAGRGVEHRHRALRAHGVEEGLQREDGRLLDEDPDRRGGGRAIGEGHRHRVDAGQ